MSSFLATLQDDVPLEVHTRDRSTIKRTTDLMRIVTMSKWRQDELRAPIDDLIEPTGAITLFPIQRAALTHAWHAGGLFAPIGVGGGKSLICCLLPAVLQRRAIILVKASLEAQFRRMRRDYSRAFNLRGDTKIVSVGVMQHASGTNLLEKLMPDLIIIDEAHLFAGKDSARRRRLERYWKEHPNTQLCVLSGSMTRKRVRDFSHLLQWALGEGSPLPLAWNTLTEWGETLDISRRPRAPGHLRRLADPGETCESPEDARRVWSRRLYQTAGVVADLSPERLPCSLTLRMIKGPKVPAIDTALAQLHATWTRPDGEELVTALDVHRVARELKQGGYHRWRETPPFEWMEARRNWHKELREWLKRNADTHYDSPMLVANAIGRGEIPELKETYLRWKFEKGQIPEPSTKWEWITTEFVEHVARYLKTEPAQICWVDSLPVGGAIAHAAGVPFYAANSDPAKERGNRSIVATIQAHGTGRNLQAFSRSLMVACPSACADMEQLLGRTHRTGQPADEVIYLFFDSSEDDVRSALKGAPYQAMMHGTQRIAYCDKEGWSE